MNLMDVKSFTADVAEGPSDWANIRLALAVVLVIHCMYLSTIFGEHVHSSQLRIKSATFKLKKLIPPSCAETQVATLRLGC